MFDDIQKNKASEDVALQLEETLSSDSFSIGDKLPCERTLQKQFQVGRGTIREALGILRQKGWIETRKGSKGGSFVSQPSTDLLNENMLSLIKRSQISLQHLIEFRHHIDAIIARLAMENYTKPQIKELLKKSKAMMVLSEEKNPNLQELVKYDFELNILCAQMTKNPFLEWIIQSIQSSVDYQNNLLYQNSEHIKTIGKIWYNYSVALSEKNITTTQAILGYHHLLLNDYFKDKDNTLLPK